MNAPLQSSGLRVGPSVEGLSINPVRTKEIPGFARRLSFVVEHTLGWII